ncbi:OmpP1/FadL family transporter [Pseudofulvibacter geojedonensis]|uniref:OmpP1/FadL family transporter n=1 Tax=Pseudofulvibacter geojedonensis TaxID=1123758 RepID=A0ABW3I0G3_9FLAO
MKNKYLVILSFLGIGFGFSQTVQDALLYSNDVDLGSARYQAMSGAFGALGGDLSAINVNPAGSAVFKNSLVAFSLGVNTKENDAKYFNTQTNTSTSRLAINQGGGVFVLNNTDEESNWKKVTFGLNYQQTQNFDQDYFFAGQSPNSINAYFLSHANGLAFQDIQILSGEYIEEAYLNIASQLGYNYQQAFLGYYGGIIDPEDANDPLGTIYVPTATIDNTVYQEYFYASNGNVGKFNFNVAGQFQDDWYFGANLNVHTIFTERNSRIRENGYEASSNLEFVVFDNYLRSTGAGVSLQAGVIKKFDNVRLGLSYQSPTWYEIEEEQSQRINSNLADADIGFINYDLVTIFRPYRLRTPSNITASAAVVFAKKGLLSFDYNYKDYNNIKMKPTRDFVTANSFINNNLTGASSYKIGAEYRVANWSLRGGYRFEESPYKDTSVIDDLTGFSLGFGYNFGRTKLDIAYAQTKQDVNHQLYDTGLTNSATVNSTNTNVTATLSYSF